MNNKYVINKFIDFANQADCNTFITIFGKDKGNRLYHNSYLNGKNMPKFISSLPEIDQQLILNYFHETFCSQ